MSLTLSSSLMMTVWIKLLAILLLTSIMLNSTLAKPSSSSPLSALQSTEPLSPVDKEWPFMFDTDSYSYQPYGQMFNLRVYNMPVSEGNQFNLNFTLFNMIINHKVHTDDSTIDQIEIDVITQYWIDSNPERDVITIKVPLNATNGAVSIPITFPERSQPFIPASSHQFLFKVPTHDINEKAGISLSLTKVDNTMRYIMNKVFNIPGYNNTLASRLKLELDTSKSSQKNAEKVYQRSFEIELDGLSTPIQLNSTTLYITNNSTGQWSMVQHADAPECLLSSNKTSYKLNVASFAPGIWSLSPADLATPVIIEKGKSLEIECPGWDFRFTKELMDKRLAWTVYTQIPNSLVINTINLSPQQITTTPINTTTRSNSILMAEMKTSYRWVVGVIILVIMFVIIAATLIIVCKCNGSNSNSDKKKENKNREQTTMMSDYE